MAGQDMEVMLGIRFRLELKQIEKGGGNYHIEERKG